MIRHLKGKLLFATPPVFVLDINGVGYEVISSTIKSQPGNDLACSIYTVVKEDSFTLYGFNNEEERGLFGMLIGVNGVGPKSALTILGSISGPEIVSALENKDPNPFTKVKGIGKKAAERIVIDLAGSINLTASNEDAFALSAALQNLGYTRREYEKLIAEAPNSSIEEQLTWALQKLNRS